MGNFLLKILFFDMSFEDEFPATHAKMTAYRESFPPEMKAKYEEHKQKMQDEEYKNGVIEEMKTNWNDADANKDGLLNADEWVVFMQKTHACNEARFGAHDAPAAELTAELYRTANLFTPGTDGVSMADFIAIR